MREEELVEVLTAQQGSRQSVRATAASTSVLFPGL